MSDIAGQDIHTSSGTPRAVISAVRNWLRSASGRKGLPGGSEVHARYRRFRSHLPRIGQELRREPKELTFADFSEIAEVWLRRN